MKGRVSAVPRWGLLFVAVAACAAPLRPPPILASYGSRVGANGFARLGPHAGVDFAGALETPVLAAAQGVVVALAPRWSGCGIGVLVSHPEHARYTVYCHLAAVTVRLGAQVKRGEAIGRLGQTGRAAGVPHVHLELCTAPCRSGHADGALAGTEDPSPHLGGCFHAGNSYSTKKLLLTFPVRCEPRRAGE